MQTPRIPAMAVFLVQQCSSSEWTALHARPSSDNRSMVYVRFCISCIRSGTQAEFLVQWGSDTPFPCMLAWLAAFLQLGDDLCKKRENCIRDACVRLLSDCIRSATPAGGCSCCLPCCAGVPQAPSSLCAWMNRGTCSTLAQTSQPSR